MTWLGNEQINIIGWGALLVAYDRHWTHRFCFNFSISELILFIWIDILLIWSFSYLFSCSVFPNCSFSSNLSVTLIKTRIRSWSTYSLSCMISSELLLLNIVFCIYLSWSTYSLSCSSELLFLDIVFCISLMVFYALLSFKETSSL